MTDKTMTDDMLIERLNSEPVLRSRIVGLLELISNPNGDFDTADSAEAQVIGDLQHFGQEILSAWANKTEQTCQHGPQCPGDQATKHGKKKSTGIQSTAKSI